MSNYNHEDGFWTLPSRDYLALKKRVRSALKQADDSLFAKLIRMNEIIRVAAQGKRIAYKLPFIVNILERNCIDGDSFAGLFLSTDGKRFVKPTRKGFNQIRKPITNRSSVFAAHTDSFTSEDGCAFCDKRCTIKWVVSENNHAVEQAHESILYDTLMAGLRAVKWTKRTGGSLRYSDEFIKDDYGCPDVQKWGNAA